MYVVKILSASKGKFIIDPLHPSPFPSYEAAIGHIQTYGLSGAKVALA